MKRSDIEIEINNLPKQLTRIQNHNKNATLTRGRVHTNIHSVGVSEAEETEKRAENVGMMKLWLKMSFNLGLSWWSSGEDSVPPLQGMVLNLVWERSCKAD